MKKYFDSLQATLNEVEPHIKNMEDISNNFVQRINNGGRIFIVVAGPVAKMTDYLYDSFRYLFKLDWEKIHIIEAARRHEQSFRDKNEWKHLENDKSIGAIDAIEMGINECDYVLGLSVTGNTKYINQFLKQSGDSGAGTAIITSSTKAEELSYIDTTINFQVQNKTVKGLYIGNHTTILKLCVEVIFFDVFEKLGQIINGMIMTTKIWTDKLFMVSMNVLWEIDPNLSIEDGRQLVKESDGELSIAILKLLKNYTTEEAKNILEDNKYDFNKIGILFPILK